MEYPGVKALAGVDFDVRAGEIHALCGENGAGKSTLIKILSGIIPHGRYGGQVFRGGSDSEARFAGPGDALKAGIRVIHQELALCPDFTVAQNIFLGAEPLRNGILDEARMTREARRALEKLGLAHLDPEAKIESLPVGLRQMVEIARALRQAGDTDDPTEVNRDVNPEDARVLILDEPTSALSAPEAETLERTLRRLRAEGHGILYISHRLDEVFRLADRITVLRNGESCGTLERSEAGPEAAGFDAGQVVALMVGKPAGKQVGKPASELSEQLSKPVTNLGEGKSDESSSPLLSVRHWNVPAPSLGKRGEQRKVVEDVSFDLHPGEILGIAGLMGAGRTELVESLCGLYPRRGDGSVEIAGRPYRPRDARHAHAHGLALVSEDRRGHGILPERSVRANMSASSLRDFCSRIPGFSWLLDEPRERAAVRERMASLRVKAPDTEFPISHLSGGNQQKVLVGRALMTKPRILSLDEPTRGIAVGAKEEIYGLVRELASLGMAVLLISSENDEVLKLSHRVLVMRGGRVVAERRVMDGTEELTQDHLLALASGGTH